MDKYQQEDLLMMQQSGRWPNWPFLPLKKSKSDGGWPDGAVLVDTGNNKPWLIKENMFQLVNEIRTKKKTFSDYEKTDYNSLEDLVAEGWMVD